MMIVPSEPSGRLRGDRGAALVEAGLMSPVMLFLFLAIFEFGFFFSSYDALGRAATDASRAASVQGNAAEADWEIVQSIKRSMGAVKPARVEKVVVFKASGPAATAPTSCTAGTARVTSNVGGATTPAAGSCNGYTGPNDLAGTSIKDNYACGASPNNLSTGYCPLYRKVAYGGPDGPPDYIGVYIRYSHRFVTGLFGSTRLLTETVITRVEPQSVI